MRTTDIDLPWPSWSLTIGAMADAHVIVHAHCTRCGVTMLVDIPTLIELRSRHYSLIDRSARCKVVRCYGRVFFLAGRPDANRPMLQLTSRPRQRA